MHTPHDYIWFLTKSTPDEHTQGKTAGRAPLSATLMPVTLQSALPLKWFSSSHLLPWRQASLLKLLNLLLSVISWQLLFWVFWFLLMSFSWPLWQSPSLVFAETSCVWDPHAPSPSCVPPTLSFPAGTSPSLALHLHGRSATVEPLMKDHPHVRSNFLKQAKFKQNPHLWQHLLPKISKRTFWSSFGYKHFLKWPALHNALCWKDRENIGKSYSAAFMHTVCMCIYVHVCHIHVDA